MNMQARRARYLAAAVALVGLAGGERSFETRYDAPELERRLGALFGVAMGSFAVRARRFVVPLIDGEEGTP